MYELPYGNTQQLNLDWFIKRWQEFYAQWQEAEAGIDHALDAEIQRVEDAMQDLYAARDAAAASAASAAASAASASNSATTAGNAATAAAASATLANNKATAAGLSEAAAANSANSASNSAGAAATSASQANASAASATASEQSATASAQGAAASAQNAAVSETNAAASAEDAEESAQRAEDAAAAAQMGSVVKSVENVPIASVDDALDENVVELVIGINPVQTGTGDPAPDNVRPITGWTGANIVNVDSFNIFDGVLEVGGISTSTGGNITQTDRQRSTNYIAIKPQASFYFYLNGTIGKTVFFYSANKTLISYQDLGTSNTTFSTPPNTEFIRFIVRTTSAINVCINPNDAEKNGQFYPYGTATTYPVAFPVEAGTVYSGILDLTNGILTVDRLSVTFDGSQSNFAFAEGTTANRITWNGFNSIGIGGKPFISDTFKPDSNSTGIKTTPWLIYNAVSDPRMFMSVPTTITSVADFVAYCTQNPIMVVYPLATPIAYTLTESQIIELLNGNNNVWANTGNINLLRYYADSKGYIDAQDALVKALIAKELDDMIADTALTGNDFRIVNNTLYRITAPIASGATLTPNTNCTATTVSEILKTLLT